MFYLHQIAFTDSKRACSLQAIPMILQPAIKHHP
jgi:hypothetical protein